MPKAPYTLEAPVRSADAVALSPDGTTGAVADTGTVYVGSIAPADEVRAAATELVGVGSIDRGSVRFLGNSHLIASSGSRLVLWDLTAIDRIATTAAVPMGSGCHACGPPQVDLSPDGALAFVPDNFGADNFQLVSLPGLTLRDRFAFSAEQYTYQGSSWTRDGKLVVLVLGELPDGSLPPPVKLLHVDQPVVAVGGGPADSDVVAIMADGRVLRFDATTGESVEVAPAVTGELASGPGSGVPVASVGSTGLAAFTQGTVVTAIDPESGRSGRRDMLEDVTAVEIAGTRVLIRTSSGTGVWDRSLTRQGRMIPGDVTGDGRWAPVASPTGRLVAQAREDSSVSLIDVESGSELTSFRATSPGLRTGIAFSSDDSKIITITEPSGGYGISGNGTLVARSISDDALIRSACATAGRDLTQAEWFQAVDAQPPDSLTCPL